MAQSQAMQNRLQGIRIAILCTDGVEQSELESPLNALKNAGAHVEIVSPKSDQIVAWKHYDKGDSFDVDTNLAHANVDDFDGLVLPGGVANPDQLRSDEDAVNFVRGFVKNEKPIASICHGPWTLIEADAVRGKKMTSWPSIKTDLINAGANWSDVRVAKDENLVTSRKPDDLPDFNEAIIELFSHAAHKAAGKTTDARKKAPSAAPSAQI